MGCWGVVELGWPCDAVEGAAASHTHVLRSHPGPAACSSAVPALGAIAEQPGSGRSREVEEGSQGGSPQQQEQQPAGGDPGQQQLEGGPAAQVTPQPAALSSRLSPTGAGPAPASAVDSPVDSCASSAASTPLAAHGARRGLPLPAGVPQIALQALPLPKLQPQPDSNDWYRYAESVSEASASLGGSTQRQRGGTASPDSDAASPPPTGGRRRTAPLPGSGGSGDITGLLEAAAGGSGRGSGGAYASAPATARLAASLPLSPSGERAPAAAGAGSALHRLAQASGPDAAQQDVAQPVLAPAATFSPRGTARSEGGGLARTTSAPAGRVATAAAAEERRRQAARLGAVPGREASVVDLTSPEAVAIQGRIHSRLSRPVTDRLVQVGGQGPGRERGRDW